MSHKNKSDVELLKLYREQEDLTAFKVLFDRYVKYSRILASEIVEELRFDFLVDFQELVDLGILSFYIATVKFDAEDYFKAFWKQIATYQMKNFVYDDIKYRRAIARLQMLEEKVGESQKPVYSNCFSDGSSGSEELLMRDIIQFLFNPANKIDQKSALMFLDHIDGMTYEDITIKYNCSVSTVKRRVNKVRQAVIANVLGEKI